MKWKKKINLLQRHALIDQNLSKFITNKNLIVIFENSSDKSMKQILLSRWFWTTFNTELHM